MSLPDFTSFPTKHPWIFWAVISALTYLFRTAIEALIKQIFRPFRWLGKKFYWWIAPRNPFSISIRKYKQHISRSNLAFLENPVGPALKVSLEQSFAPLRLVSTDSKREIDLFSYVAQSDRFIVLGGPGTGKTTLMKSLVQSVIQKRCASQPSLNNYIPVFIVLRNLAAKSHTVEQAIVFALGEHHFPRAEKYVESALADGRLIVILDGLDEVGPNRRFVVQKITEFCNHDEQRKKKNRVIVTCRENSYRTRDLRSVISEVVRVEPFGNDHMRIFLQGWPPHSGKYALSLFSQIQDDSQIKEVCRNPLLLTILTGLFLDTEKFELPTSRDSFYAAAVDELMHQRPERRGIEQKFSIGIKYRLLESTALKRLEDATVDEDPEEFHKGTLEAACREFFGEKADPEALLREFTEVNGILRFTGDESYTFPHRTLQEFLAAKECYRSKDPAGFLNEAAQRTELLEVLHFYCGIIKNIPQLNAILQAFITNKQYIEAARCLVNMTEDPSTALIDQISAALVDIVSVDDDPEPALIVLSSLSGRQSLSFHSAKAAFGKAVDLIAHANSKGTSALESALATSPELAMRIIPGLLQSESSERRKSALALLRDIGTDQALDELVRLLGHTSAELRTEAAYVVSSIIKTRSHKLISRAVLLPERPVEPSIWPLENFFPSRLALPLIEALSGTQYVASNAAIACGVSFFNISHGSRSSDSHIANFWPRIAMDLHLKRLRVKAAHYLAKYTRLSYLATIICLFALNFYQYTVSKKPSIHTQPPSPPSSPPTTEIILLALLSFLLFAPFLYEMKKVVGKISSKQRNGFAAFIVAFVEPMNLGGTDSWFARNLLKDKMRAWLTAGANISFLLIVFWRSSNGIWLLRASSVVSTVFSVLTLIFLFADWPKNPLLYVADDIQPSELWSLETQANDLLKRKVAKAS